MHHICSVIATMPVVLQSDVICAVFALPMTDHPVTMLCKSPLQPLGMDPFRTTSCDHGNSDEAMSRVLFTHPAGEPLTRLLPCQGALSMAVAAYTVAMLAVPHEPDMRWQSR